MLLARDLRAAQNRAAYLAEASDFVFPEDGDGYEVRDAEGNLVRNPRTDNAFQREYSFDGVFRGVRVESVEAGGDRTLRYDEDGRAGESIRVTLRFGEGKRVIVVEKGRRGKCASWDRRAAGATWGY